MEVHDVRPKSPTSGVYEANLRLQMQIENFQVSRGYARQSKEAAEVMICLLLGAKGIIGEGAVDAV